MSAEFYPFDVEKLNKGDLITPDRCEEVIGVSRCNPHYALKLLGLREELERQWARLRGEVVTTTCEDSGIRICTDEMAVEENRRRRESHVRGLKRAQVRQMGVIVTNLSPELKQIHEREVIVGSAFLLGGKKAARAALKSHKRDSPALLTTGKKAP